MDDIVLRKCRACLNTDQNGSDLLKSSYLPLFTEFTNLQVSSNDDITKFLCQACCTNLKTFDEFKKVCIESDLVLRKLHIKNEIEEFQTEHLVVKVETDPDCQSLSGEDDDNSSEESYFDEQPEHTSFKGEEDIVCDEPVRKTKKWKKTSSNDKPRESRPRIECPKCDKIFHKQVRLEEHLRLHNGEKAPEICKLCNKELANPRSLKRHMKSHIGERKYICQYCQKGFVHSDTLRVHERTHLDEKNYICDECGMGFKNFVNLRIHQKNRHIQDRPHACDICHKTFKMKSTLNEHKITLHIESKNFLCDQCNGQYKSKKALSRHIVTVHCTERNYVCTSCGKKFKTHMQLKLHNRQHTGERPYACPYETCSMAFGTKTVLTKHIMVHTGERPAKCQLCSKGFYQQSDLDRHMKVHNKQ